MSLFLKLFFLLPFEVFLFSDGFCLFDFLLSLLHEILPHFFLFFDLLFLAFEVALFLPLSTISVISKASSSHGGCDVLDFFDVNRSQRMMSVFHVSLDEAAIDILW